MTELLQSPDKRFVVVQSEPWMAQELEAIQRASFPSLAQHELISAEQYRAHMQVFPEGQHAVLERQSGRVVACSTDLRTQVDFSHYQHRYPRPWGQLAHHPQPLRRLALRRRHRRPPRVSRA